MPRATRTQPAPGSPPGLIPPAFGILAAEAVLAGLRLGLIEEVAARPATARQLARKVGAKERGVRVLLDALVALGQLGKEGEQYCLSASTQMLLSLPGVDAKSYCADALLHLSAFSDGLRQLANVVRTGRPPSADPADTERFLVALAGSLFPFNYPVARALCHRIRGEFGRGPLAILDVAAGGAPWSMPFAQGNRQARVTAVDFPAVLEVARHYAQAAGVEGQYELLPGDIRKAPFGNGQFDLAILGHICHSEGPNRTPRLFRKVAQALKPGGVMLVLDFVADEHRTGEGSGALALLFALNMLVSATDGDTFTESQYRLWGVQAGFSGPERLELPAPYPALLFRK
ncbi:MAG: methyltransferase domain-containing protein [Armatimonadetes bacterium]|nr:methyltransferase domain-containing protein [Armatimonadota bacterium]